MNAVLQYVLYVGILVAISVPLGIYMSKVMDGETTIISRVLGPVERGIYKLLRIDPNENMSWKKYLAAALLFNLFGFVLLLLILLCQGVLPWNPQGLPGLSWHLAFNTAASFTTNTNWQAYSGEVTLSNFSQAMGLTVQNFVSAASGIAVLWCLIRGLTVIKKYGVGNFWQDLVLCTLYILLPICLVSTLVFTQQGIPQTLSGNRYVDLVEPIAADAEGNYLPDAEIDVDAGTVTVDGEAVEDAKIVTKLQTGLPGRDAGGRHSADDSERISAGNHWIPVWVEIPDSGGNPGQLHGDLSAVLQVHLPAGRTVFPV